MRAIKSVIAATAMALVLFAAPAALAASAPTVITLPNTPEPGGSVRLHGYVTPEGSQVTGCEFEYGPEPGTYDAEVPCANHPGNEVQILSLFGGSGSFKLAFGAETTADLPFDATAAEVEAALRALAAIGPEGVSVSAAGPAQGFVFLRIAFQGPLADTDVATLKVVQGSEPFPAFVDVLVPGGFTEPDEVTADPEGLTPGATYHYRLVAENGSGQAMSPDASFTVAAEPATESCPNTGSPGAGFLPDCRAWEMVSPPDKNGGNVTLYGQRLRIAADGSAALFPSKTPFGDGPGVGVASEHLSLRSPTGWSTHGVMPPQPPATFNALASSLDPNYEGDLSASLEKGVVFAWKALNEEDPNVDEVGNLYLREDLRSSGAGAYRLVTKCPLCAEKEVSLPGSLLHERPWFVAATPDFSRILFGSVLNLAKGPDGQEPKGLGYKLYEWDEGTVTLAGILPNGKAAAESLAGWGKDPAYRPIHHAVMSEDGSKVFFTDKEGGGAGNLYMRVDGEETVQLNLPVAGAPVESQKPAAFADASADGSRVFFTSDQRLTPDAEGIGNDSDLYVYDTTLPPSDPAHLTFIASEVRYPLGASADGNIFYFWVPGGFKFPGLHGVDALNTLLAWQDGRIRYLGAGTDSDEPRSGYQGSGFAKSTYIGPDGSLLVTLSPAVGPGGDNQRNPNANNKPGSTYCGSAATGDGCKELYFYSPITDALECVSCNPSGLPPAVQPLIVAEPAEVGVGQQGVPASTHVPRSISEADAHVFFSSREALTSEDTNGAFDAYEFDPRTLEVRLLSSGTDPEPSFFGDASASGDDALIATHQRLSGWDFDSAFDLYDARVDGGVPEPAPTPASCEGESCRPPVSTPPPAEPASSALFSGPGNRKQPRRPRKRHHAHRHHRHANRDRGGRR